MKLSKLLWELWAHGFGMTQCHELLEQFGYVIHTELLQAELRKRDIQFFTDCACSATDMTAWSAG